MTTETSLLTVAVQAIILLLAVLSLLLSAWASRVGSPVIAIFSRWVRWFFLAALTGGTTYVFNWTGYSLPILLSVSLLLIFLLETTYNWIAISALSKSDLPLFPKFEENDRGEEWPSSTRFIKLKSWLRQTGFQKRQFLVSMLGDSVLMRISVYENEDQTTRLHILFFPNARGSTAASFTFYSVTQGGTTLVTDNVFLPFGGFYPESWLIERKPWTRSVDKLQEHHRARIDARAEGLMPFVLSPLEQINEDQRMIEQLNQDLGFLVPIPEVLERGRLTPAGKARIWQEIWTLSYLGKPLRYN